MDRTDKKPVCGVWRRPFDSHKNLEKEIGGNEGGYYVVAKRVYSCLESLLAFVVVPLVCFRFLLRRLVLFVPRASAGSRGVSTFRRSRQRKIHFRSKDPKANSGNWIERYILFGK